MIDTTPYFPSASARHLVGDVIPAGDVADKDVVLMEYGIADKTFLSTFNGTS